tara:strand:- start:63118 stop:63519 length:402 start_codon:yes stop_codon:yes gene_type:complete
MSEEYNSRASLENQAFALMGRMHVMLRRQSGRVTDIEYMHIDPGYCRYLLKMASLSPNEDLQEVGLRLQEIFFGDDGLFVRKEPKAPLLSRQTDLEQAPPAISPATSKTPTNASSSAPGTDDQVDRGYIGRLR